MKKWTQRLIACTAAAALLTSAVSALDLSLDNYKEVAEQHSTTILANNQLNEGAKEDKRNMKVVQVDGSGNISISEGYTYSGAEIYQLRMQDRQNESDNASVPYSLGSSLITYYSLQLQYADLLSQEKTLESNLALMEKRVELGMATQLDLLNLQNSMVQLQNGKAAMENSIQMMKSNLAISLGVTQEELNILPMELYTAEEEATLKEQLEGMYDWKSAHQNNWNLKLMRMSGGLMGNKQYQGLVTQMETFEVTLQQLYDSAYEDMLNKYDAYMIAKQVYLQKADDFVIVQKKHEQGMISDTDYLAQEIQFAADQRAIDNAVLDLYKAEMKMEAYNNGVMLQETASA